MLALLTALALAQATQNPYLEKARGLAKSLEFAGAIEQLQVARQVPELDPTQRAQVLELLAHCQIALGHRADAEASFTELLLGAPSWALDVETTSPKIVEVFDAVKRRMYPEDLVSLVEEPAPPGRVRVRVVDPWRKVEELMRFERRDGAWTAVPLSRDGDLTTFELPVPTRGALAWYVGARGTKGEVLATLGSEKEPRTLTAAPPAVVAVPPEPARPLLAPTKLAAIVSAAVAVAALATAAGLQVDSGAQARAARDSTRPPGDWADTARAAQARAVAEARWSTALFSAAGATGAAAVVLFAW